MSRLVRLALLSPSGGTIADRHDRRHLMIYSDLTNAGLMFALSGVALVSGPVPLAVLMATFAGVAITPYGGNVRVTDR